MALYIIDGILIYNKYAEPLEAAEESMELKNDDIYSVGYVMVLQT